MPSRAARRTKRSPDCTVSEVPATSSASRGLDHRVAALDPVLGHVRPEEHHVRHQRSAADQAAGEPEVLDVQHLGVAVRRGAGVDAGPEPGVELGRAGRAATAREVTSSQRRHTTSSIRPCRSTTARLPAAPCSPSTFWVIRPASAARVLEPGQRSVPGVRRRAPHPTPADVAARPVALLRRRPGDELLERHRLARDGGRPAVVGDARVGRQPGTGERDDAATLQQVDRGGQLVHPVSLRRGWRPARPGCARCRTRCPRGRPARPSPTPSGSAVVGDQASRRRPAPARTCSSRVVSVGDDVQVDAVLDLLGLRHRDEQQLQAARRAQRTHRVPGVVGVVRVLGEVRDRAPRSRRAAPSGGSRR